MAGLVALDGLQAGDVVVGNVAAAAAADVAFAESCIVADAACGNSGKIEAAVVEASYNWDNAAVVVVVVYFVVLVVEAVGNCFRAFDCIVSF